MAKFYSDHQLYKVHAVKQCLDEAGIPNFIKNEFAQGAIGELSAVDNQPEVWLTDESWRSYAQKCLTELILTEPADNNDIDWHCRECGEVNEGQFGVCWQCQTPHL
ncbi:MAG: DUF2007 domain-containing protein [Glaciecola sp.]|jgi:hypothetical protein